MRLPPVKLCLLLLASLWLGGCGEKATDSARVTAPIHVTVEIVDFAKLSKQGAALVAKLTETDQITGESGSHASIQIGNINAAYIGFELPQPSKLNSDVRYGISIELKTGNERPSFSAWYPLDLERYDGEPLVARLFPADSSVLINYQIMAYSCDQLSLEIGTDGENLWLNAGGAGYFLNKTEAGNFANNYASFDVDSAALKLGQTDYQCQHQGSGDRMAKLRFGGVKLRGINREQGWIVSVYDNHINYVTERGFNTTILPLQTSMPLNGNWSLTTTNGLRVQYAPYGKCDNGMQAIALVDNTDITPGCAEKLR